MNKKLIIISATSIIIIVLLVLVLAVGGKNYIDENQKEINLENQRKAALIIKRKEPSASKIVFTSEGYYPGFGVPWTVGADVTMEKEVFRILLDSVDNYYSVHFGTSMDKVNSYDEIHNKKINNHISLEVIYHNGKKEVFN